MDRQEKKYLEKALREKTPHETFSKSLARVVGEKVRGKRGYKLYIDLMEDVRSLAREKDISNERAVKSILGQA